MKIYISGSLRNPRVQKIAIAVRKLGFEVFDDWQAAGPEADDYWQKYEQERGRSYREALRGYAARNVFQFDKAHLDSSDAGVLVMPAGKSSHIEMGYLIGRGKPFWVLFEEEPERFDQMYQFATDVCFELPDLLDRMEYVLRDLGPGAIARSDIYDGSRYDGSRDIDYD